MLVALYRALLWLWPRDIRRDLGIEMQIGFADCLERERRRRGRWGVCWSAVAGLVDPAIALRAD